MELNEFQKFTASILADSGVLGNLLVIDAPTGESHYEPSTFDRVMMLNQ